MVTPRRRVSRKVSIKPWYALTSSLFHLCLLMNNASCWRNNLYLFVFKYICSLFKLFDNCFYIILEHIMHLFPCIGCVESQHMTFTSSSSRLPSQFMDHLFAKGRGAVSAGGRAHGWLVPQAGGILVLCGCNARWGVFLGLGALSPWTMTCRYWEHLASRRVMASLQVSP